MMQFENDALYELARELISSRMSPLSSQLWRERNRLDRDEALCAHIKEQSAQLFIEREALSSRDRASLEACIRKYAKSPTGAEEAIAAIAEFYRGSD